MRNEEVEWDAGQKAGDSQATSDQHGCEKVKSVREGRREDGEWEGEERRI